ncbi:MAG: extracellular solute-binding protein [Bacilli bacterium]|nr:extracellular solute-binding protein [Bacilli bacterium]
MNKIFINKNVKKIFITSIIVLLLVVLSGCVKNEVITVSGKTKITFYNAYAMSGKNLFSDIIENFEKTYPMFEIEEVRCVSFEDIETNVLSKKVEELPTIVQAKRENIVKFLEKDLVVNLNQYISNGYITSEYIDYLDDDNWLSEDIIGLTNNDILDIIPSFYEEGAIYGDSQMYSLPFGKTVEVLYYNKDFMIEHYEDLTKFNIESNGDWNNPTWEDVLGVAEYYKMVTMNASAKKVGFMTDDLTNLLINLTHQAGSKFSEYNGKNIVYTFNNDLSKEATKWLARNYQENLFGMVSDYDVQYASDVFKNGHCLMVVDSTGSFGYYANNKFEVGVTTYPQKDENNQSVTTSGSTFCLLNKNNDLETLGGWLFLKWLTNYENSLYLSTNTNYLPIRKSVYESDLFQDKLNSEQLIFEVKKIGFEQHQMFKTVIPFDNDINKIIEQMVIDCVDGKSIDEAFELAIEKIKK